MTKSSICVAFHGDLILSRACHEDSIVLWQIEGFSSTDPIPGPLDAPTPTDVAKQTRSYFTPTLSQDRRAMFTRLAQFHTPDCGVHPRRAQKAPAVQKPAWLMVKRGKKTAAANAAAHAAAGGEGGTPSLRSFVMSGGASAADKESMVSASPDPEGVATGLGYSKETLQAWAEMYDLSNPVGYIKAHRTLQIDGGFVGRQVGWSPEGEWCVVVGNGNRALIYQRWAKEKGVATAMAVSVVVGFRLLTARFPFFQPIEPVVYRLVDVHIAVLFLPAASLLHFLQPPLVRSMRRFHLGTEECDLEVQHAVNAAGMLLAVRVLLDEILVRRRWRRSWGGDCGGGRSRGSGGFAVRGGQPALSVSAPTPASLGGGRVVVGVAGGGGGEGCGGGGGGGGVAGGVGFGVGVGGGGGGDLFAGGPESDAVREAWVGFGGEGFLG
ncbi:hypothetical protein CHGG_04841 [Chaetomium globosum CBS 148.51]|uniref:Polycomb protein EED-like insertion domain-containing protein n=1 Tax=Chaetomium globosum (strain ATCC 6205 / CBS 148.51 / DSM 1962 / NBRC 6347 / NRRL 1970) TaxID=306901 RepID=Q2H055_CHAGB|nr:uncharacterized protein CHGG_04841 [Chaetomium globosum CBS 148.51]EAQ88222.1 hypothetical protein CHGG_04841 [Chaetomium globosum CBS 148.51]